jgi:hypothetical protein
MTRSRSALLVCLVAAFALVACDTEDEAPAPAASLPATPSATATATATATPPPSPAPKATEVVRFTPPKPDASTTQDGTCFARSIALSWREDTYRCMAGNSISDPCFALADASMVCGANPMRADAKPFLMRVTGGLPTQPLNAAQIEADKKNAWLVRLADGTVCGFLTGATAGFDGKRINYGCSDGTSILGDLIPGTTWTARFVTGAVGPNGFVPATDVVKPLAAVIQ